MLFLAELLDLGDLAERNAADHGVHRLARRLDDLGKVDLRLAAGLNQAADSGLVLQRDRFQLPAAGRLVGRLSEISLRGCERRKTQRKDAKAQRRKENEEKIARMIAQTCALLSLRLCASASLR